MCGGEIIDHHINTTIADLNYISGGKVKKGPDRVLFLCAFFMGGLPGARVDHPGRGVVGRAPSTHGGYILRGLSWVVGLGPRTRGGYGKGQNGSKKVDVKPLYMRFLGAICDFWSKSAPFFYVVSRQNSNKSPICVSPSKLGCYMQISVKIKPWFIA